ncbi:MAG: DNA translocase FtsK 4TM domain-containing protein [Candidatus Spechtbacterales bacterium]
MAKKKKPLKKVSSKKKKKLKHELDPGVKKGIWSTTLIAIALLSFLSLFDKAGQFGEVFSEFLNNIFGWGMYVAPFVLVAVALGFVFSWSRESNKSTVLAAFLFFSSVLGIFAISGYSSDVHILRGGYWGYLFSYVPLHFMGGVAAVILLLSIIAISVILGFHINVSKFLEGIAEQRRIRKGALDIGGAVPGKKFKKKSKSEIDEEDERGADQKEEPKSSVVENKKQNKKRGKQKEESFTQLTQGEFANYEFPSSELLEPETGKPTSGDIVANANIIKRTLQNFGIDVEMGEVNVGPTVTQYTLKPAEGVKLARITALGNDLSLALAAHPIRIEAPIPGRSFVGIEIPNKATTWVRLRNLIENPKFAEAEGDLTMALGRDVKGAPVYADLSRMPHLLIAGSTGSGKTIALNAVILSMLYKNHPRLLRFIMVDPKRVEFSVYADIPHLLAPIVVDNSKAVNALKWAVNEMERRFDELSQVGSRDIFSYNNNKKVIEAGDQLPYIVIVIDELADLMSSKGKEVEALIVRIAQMARAVGIHLVLATQRPSVEVITGLIKANITARMAFQVASQVDSRTVLDMGGAEKLLGKGDMLYLSPDRSKPSRVQGAFVSETEIKKVTDHLRKQRENLRTEESGVEEVKDFSPRAVNSPNHSIDFDGAGLSKADDELYDYAKQLVIEAQKASASYLQRKLRVGYARAASLLDMLEENGVVGPAEGSKPRDVYLEEEDMAGQKMLEENADNEEYEEDDDEYLA